MDAAQSIEPLDLHRMFLGDQVGLLFLLEICIRTAVMYGYAMVFARFVGKRGVGQISPFEFLLIIIISSAAGDPMFYPHVPLIHGILVLTVVMMMHHGVSLLTDRSERAEDVMEGEPILVVDDGSVVEGSLRAATISRRELLMLLREQGVTDIGELARAYFEPNGQVSIFKAEEESRKQTESTHPKQFKRG